MHYGFSEKDFLQFRKLLDGLLGWLLYLDSCSLGKSSEVIHSLDEMSKTLKSCKNLLNKGIKFVD